MSTRKWMMIVLLACVSVGFGGEALALKSQLLFQVKTNQSPNKIYRFYALMKGASKRLVGVRYVRMSRVRRGSRSRYLSDACYPLRYSVGQIQRGVALLRKYRAPAMSRTLARLLQARASGALSRSQGRRLKQQMKKYCAKALSPKVNNGRFINSIRAYGLDPHTGGTIVVTYLRNALLNFFRGEYHYVVLKLRRKKGRWVITTRSGKKAHKLFFRAYALGISSVELGHHSRRRPKVPSKRCAAIEKRAGTCRLSTSQRRTMLQPTRTSLGD